MKVKRGDTVVITNGKDNGKKGKVIRALPEANRIVVEKINMAIKHVKKTNAQPGGRISLEMPIHASNAMVICPQCQKATRVGYQIPKEGKKYRVCKHCHESVEKPFSKAA